MKFIITVDVEADNQWKSNNNSLLNIPHLVKFQSLCEKYSFIPTYLVSYEVAQDQKSVDILKSISRDKKAEIGAHFHPWTVPPIDEDQKKYPSDLSDDILKDKLKKLTDILENSFGMKMTSYRAGRWGFDERQAKALKDLGYLVDCSVTPKINWKSINKEEGAPDFREYTSKPKRIFEGLWEVPTTILFTGILKNENSFFAKIFNRMDDSLLKKIFNKLFFQIKWLRIFQSSNKRDWKKIYKSAKKNNLPVLVFMIHSSELMAGGSPYAEDDLEVEKIYSNLEAMFKFFSEQDVEGISLSNFVKNIK